MRVLNIFTWFLLVSNYCYGQYLPIAIENTHWIVFDGNGIDIDGSLNRHYVLSIRGDSVINDTLYKKLIIREYLPPSQNILDAVPPYLISEDPTLYALLRDDTTLHKLFGRVPRTLFKVDHILTSDTLIHDFSGSQGDSIKGYYFRSPMHIDSVVNRSLFGKTRSTQIAVMGGPLDEFYEGFGMIGGGPLTYYDTLRTNSGNPVVIDYCIGTDAQCHLDESTSLLSYQESEIKVFPSPADSWITVRIPSLSASKAEVTILTIDGISIETDVIPPNAKEVSISLQNVPPGWYFVEIRQGNARWMKKMVRE
ncbi:T9SS type A sorting domain-containing protein [Lewinella sp. IMCC34191]|uniref:T9SS type A sorting domain-containing protein n=1 Tax=Lewinella sp. IMCC34191 TaxID=2259172 RepID=UPI000E23D2B1|nr:T9SS type A sorting domain-containing protein [Lewinella sp. IMCC34191]